MTITFEVLGQPAGQGSKKHVGNGVMVESSKALKPWRTAVADAARDVADGHVMGEGPLYLAVTFRFAMPKSRRKADRELGEIPKVSAPDLDKLIRGVGDALKIGGLIRDDALFSTISARKIEVVGWVGAVITVAHA